MVPTYTLESQFLIRLINIGEIVAKSYDDKKKCFVTYPMPSR